MTAANAKSLRSGDKVYSTYYRRTETVDAVLLRPPTCTDKKIAYPLIRTKESGEYISHRLFRLE